VSGCRRVVGHVSASKFDLSQGMSQYFASARHPSPIPVSAMRKLLTLLKGY
jgi:hypothetical protein